jgi:hypothetical protein
MTNLPTPTQTPNVVIGSPRARAVIYDIFKWVSLIVFIAVSVIFAFFPPVPVWLLAVQYGATLFGVGVGFTASANTPSVSKLGH